MDLTLSCVSRSEGHGVSCKIWRQISDVMSLSDERIACFSSRLQTGVCVAAARAGCICLHAQARAHLQFPVLIFTVQHP